MTNEEKAACLSLQVRDLCIEKGVTKDNAETASLLVQQTAMQMAEWKDEQLKKVCKRCEQHIIDSGKAGCAFRSLGNDYCWED